MDNKIMLHLAQSVRFRRLPHSADLPLPTYETAGASGMDIRAVIEGGFTTIAPGSRRVIETGFEIALPEGFEGQVRPRSGLAAKLGLTVLNSPGTIDEDYRGEIKVILINLSQSPQQIKHGDRIAQLVIVPVFRLDVAEVETLDLTARGSAGFGSTGVV